MLGNRNNPPKGLNIIPYCLFFSYHLLYPCSVQSSAPKLYDSSFFLVQSNPVITDTVGTRKSVLIKRANIKENVSGGTKKTVRNNEYRPY